MDGEVNKQKLMLRDGWRHVYLPQYQDRCQMKISMYILLNHVTINGDRIV